MAQITEDFVSFETAKLLKEKGFNGRCRARYGTAGSFSYEKYEIEASECETLNAILAPTLQMAMKWLREVHNLCLEPYRTACGYLCDIARVPSGSELYQGDYEGDDEASGQFTTYEKSCEAAIKYCLENLI